MRNSSLLDELKSSVPARECDVSLEQLLFSNVLTHKKLIHKQKSIWLSYHYRIAFTKKFARESNHWLQYLACGVAENSCLVTYATWLTYKTGHNLCLGVKLTRRHEYRSVHVIQLEHSLQDECIYQGNRFYFFQSHPSFVFCLSVWTVKSLLLIVYRCCWYDTGREFHWRTKSPKFQDTGVHHLKRYLTEEGGCIAK